MVTEDEHFQEHKYSIPRQKRKKTRQKDATTLPIDNTNYCIEHEASKNKQANSELEANVNNNNSRTQNAKMKHFKDLNCMVTNADTLSNKMTEFSARISAAEKKPDIIAVTEVKPKNCRYKPGLSGFIIDGYQLFSTNIDADDGRGIILYINKDLEPEPFSLETAASEVVSTKIRLGSKEDLIIAVIYRSPNSSQDNTEKINNLIREVGNLGISHKLIMGDFNYRDINWDDWSTQGSETSQPFKFIEALRDSYMFQHIKTPTRARIDQQPTVLDLVISNEEGMVDNVNMESPLGKSDHACVNFKFLCEKAKTERPRKKYLFDRANFPKISEELRKINWSAEFDKLGNNADSAYTYLTDILKKLQDKYVPSVTTTNSRKKGAVALNRSVLRILRKKHRAWQRFLETRDGEKYKEYAKLRNKVRAETRKAKRELEREIALHAKSDPKKFWHYATAKSKVKDRISELYKNDRRETAQTDEEKAEILANFFTSVFTQEPVGPIQHVDSRTDAVLGRIEIDVHDVAKRLRSLNPGKSCGPDDIHPRILKELADEISLPLTHIFSLSLETSTLPEIWKKANVTAIFKKGDKKEPGNYRPVSLTCIPCKMLESIVRDKVMEYMKQHKLFSKQQFGFINGRSTTLQLLHVLNKWTEIIDNGGNITVAYMDFMKAFDKVPHRRLIAKMESYGINGQILRWVEAFLNERQQRTMVNGIKSSWREVTSGIPQGSVLGPLLFVVYINDLPDCVTSSIYLFADDTKLFREVNTPEDAELFQADLDQLVQWSEDWLLRFHPDKCKIMKIGSTPNDDNFYFNAAEKKSLLATTKNEKDIGVIIDEKLLFRDDINARVNKGNQIMGAIRRAYEYLDEQNFKLLFKGLVRPHLEYAAPVWKPAYKKDITSLENVQRRATRFIPSLKGLSYEERLRKLELPTLRFRRLRGDMIEIYKMFYTYDDQVDFILDKAGERITRGHSCKLEKKYARLNLRQHAFKCRTVNVWNSLPEEVVTAPNVNTFKNRLDKFWENHPQRFNWEAEDEVM